MIKKAIVDSGVFIGAKNNDDLSVTDCSLILFAQSLNIKHIFSFDSLFDKVNGIERLEEFTEDI